ncbi:MAG: tyrosine-type recombinase/integrase, partial [Candidatus Rokubacteria bacterium]|nr:tyrosine-type recombinase/integrase [Candidatus Rokubacteria bacterium]
MDAFFAHLRARNYSPATLRDYVCTLGLYGRWLESQGVADPAQADARTVGRFQVYLATQHRSPRGKRMSLGTQAKSIFVVRSLYRYLVRSGTVLHDPTQTLETPRLPKRLPRANLSPEDVQKLLEQPDTATAEGLRDKALLTVLYTTGMRRKECLQLTLYDVDLAGRTIRVMGKGNRERLVPIVSQAEEVLQSYMERARPVFLRVPTNAVWVSRR